MVFITGKHKLARDNQVCYICNFLGFKLLNAFVVGFLASFLKYNDILHLQ